MSTNYISGKAVLITGGTGSWGQALTSYLLSAGASKIIIVSRGELKQVEMARKFNESSLEFVIGDVRDYNAMRRCITGYNPDIIYHLASLKHVPICENQPEEAVKTNIQGTSNLINAVKGSSVKKFILVSTDKAVDPCNVYGMTKGVMERMVIQANAGNKYTEFLCVRAGNVLGSNGSLVPYIKECIRTGKRITVTDPNMTRFFMTLPDTIKLLGFATENGYAGEIYVLKMPSFTLGDIVQACLIKYGGESKMVDIIGSKPGEKKHEILISINEVDRVCKVHEGCYMIKPTENYSKSKLHIWEHPEFKIGIKMDKPYTSADHPGTLQGFLELLTKMEEAV